MQAVDEKCWYRPLPSDPNSTEIARAAYMESHVYGFSRAIQMFGVERYKSNTSKSIRGFHYVLEHLFPGAESGEKSRDLSSRMTSLAARAEAVRESAKKAKEMAKQKTSDFLHLGSQKGQESHPTL